MKHYPQRHRLAVARPRQRRARLHVREQASRSSRRVVPRRRGQKNRGRGALLPIAARRMAEEHRHGDAAVHRRTGEPRRHVRQRRHDLRAALPRPHGDRQPGEERYKQAFVKGLDHILEAQYANGGWPQYYPPGDGYNRYITFNDGAMARLMFFVRDVGRDDKIYGFVDADRRGKCKAAWDKGVDCILKCQVKVDGKPTVWCAQHDEKDFSPKPARTFEPLALSGSESIGLVHVLMSVEKPSPEVIAAVDAVKDYFERVKITGIKVEDRPQEGTPRGYDRFVVEDAECAADVGAVLRDGHEQAGLRRSRRRREIQAQRHRHRTPHRLQMARHLAARISSSRSTPSGRPLRRRSGQAVAITAAAAHSHWHERPHDSPLARRRLALPPRRHRPAAAEHAPRRVHAQQGRLRRAARAKPGWDDSDWRIVDLPHDWSVEGEFSPRPSRRRRLPARAASAGIAGISPSTTSDRGRHLAITFDGVATHCTVYVNGHLLHRHFCGYTPFTIDITDVARFGEDDVNTIAVRVDATLRGRVVVRRGGHLPSRVADEDQPRAHRDRRRLHQPDQAGRYRAG